jgi:hypothetical protein
VLIRILRLLRKNVRLVDRINVPQAVDIYNDLKFLHQPWYYFPELPAPLIKKPDPLLARTSFDQFIYADNEFTSFLALGTAETQERYEHYLRRLAVTLYQPADEKIWDKECVEEREQQIKTINPELLQLVFFTFGHVRNRVMDRCKTLLPRSLAKDEDKKKVHPTGRMWANLKHQAAKTLVFGDFDKLGQTNMYSVLDHLEILSKEREEARGKH